MIRKMLSINGKMEAACSIMKLLLIIGFGIKLINITVRLKKKQGER